MWGKYALEVLKALPRYLPYIVTAIKILVQSHKTSKRAQEATDAFKGEMLRRTESERVVDAMLAQSSDPAERLRIAIAEARARRSAGK